jgi:hypothetical protein
MGFNSAFKGLISRPAGIMQAVLKLRMCGDNLHSPMCCMVCRDTQISSHLVMSKTRLKSTYFEVHLFVTLNREAFNIVCVLKYLKPDAF